MDLDKSKDVCGTCKCWLGKREIGEHGTFRVSPSARGLCEMTKKSKPPHGGCDRWSRLEEEEHG